MEIFSKIYWVAWQDSADSRMNRGVVAESASRGDVKSLWKRR